ncbi:MAG: hypothetical protein LBF38_09355, partial [Deltaproteobacteria bacterium]|nr:hypothetical protein [Deltaproteobacteria bacterium]
ALSYLEAGPYLLLTAFVQKVLNGNALVLNQYAHGLGQAGLVIKYGRHLYPVGLEIKGSGKSPGQSPGQIPDKGLAKSPDKSLAQSLAKSFDRLAENMKRLLVREGWLIVIDRNPGQGWGGKISWETESRPDGLTIHAATCWGE